MAYDHYKLKEKSDAELHDWVCEQTPGTEKYNSGILESMRRVATLEKSLEIKREPGRHREMIAMIIAATSIILIVIAILNIF
jgi:hypothetical protein